MRTFVPRFGPRRKQPAGFMSNPGADGRRELPLAGSAEAFTVTPDPDAEALDVERHLATCAGRRGTELAVRTGRHRQATEGHLRLPGLAAYLSTDIDLRDGQKVVVGKTGLDGVENDLILVVAAKVTD